MNSQFNIFRLGEVADIIAGGDKPKVFSEIKSELTSIPVFANAEGKNGLQGYTDTPRIIEYAVTIAARGSNVGFVALRKEPYFPIVRLISLIPDREKLDVDYLFYNLKQNRQSGTGSGQPQITVPDISNRTISLPSLIEQQKAAKILVDLDSKIELNNNINAELEAMAKLIYDYWFVQFDFPISAATAVSMGKPELEGKPYKASGGPMVYNQQLKREIPEGWEDGVLGDLLTNISINIEPQDFPDLPYLPIDKLPTEKLYYQEYEDRNQAQSSLIKFNEDDILLGAMRVYFHRVCNAIEDGISRSTMISLRAKESYLKNYALFTLNRKEAILYATKHSTGTSIPYAKWSHSLEKYRICIPKDELVINRFNNLIDPILDKFKVLAKENQKLSELRDWLLPMLMNGQVSIKEAEEELSMAAEPEEGYGDG